MRRLRPHRVACVAAFLAVTVLAPTALADAAAQARFHDERARKAYEKGRYDDALREFFLEQRLAPNPRIAFNIALCFEQLERRDQAFQFFWEYARSGDADAERQSYASAALGRLEPEVARVDVTSDPPGARIYVDEREHGDYGVTPRVLALPAGKHTVWVEHPGHRRAEAEVVTQRGRLVAVKLAPALVVGELRVASPVRGKAEVRDAEGQPVAQGDTPLTARLPPGSYEVVVLAAGHEPWRGLAAVRADEAAVSTAAPVALPPATGDVTITSNLSGALVTLDGQPAGFSPTVLPRLTVGSHRLRLTGDGVLPWEGAVEVHADERAWVTVTLAEPPVTSRSAATWVVGGLGVAALLGAGVTGYLALDARADFDDAAAGANRAAIADRGERYTSFTDVLLGVGLVATGAAFLLYFETEQTTGQPSAASVARGER